MSLRTPSKIVSVISAPPYIVRFVTHGAAIKYSSIVRNLNKKHIAVPPGTRSITHIGFTNYTDLMNYPDINKGSMYQLIKSLPPSLVADLKQSGERLSNTLNISEGVDLTLFVYEIE